MRELLGHGTIQSKLFLETYWPRNYSQQGRFIFRHQTVLCVKLQWQEWSWQELVLQGLEYCSSETIVFQRFTIKVWSRMHRILQNRQSGEDLGQYLDYRGS